MRIATVLGLAGLCLLSPCGMTRGVADEAGAAQNRLNETAVTIMSGTAFDRDAGVVHDLAALLDDRQSLRVVPMVGQGPTQTLKDVLFLRGVDMGITHSTVLNHFATTGELGPLREQLVYVAKLFNEDIHLLARAETTSIEALNGKTVNVGPAESATQIAARIVFQALGLQVQESHLETAEAIEQLRSGGIDAAILIGAAPMNRVAEIGPDSGLKLVAIPYPKGLEDDTYPTTLAAADYPALIDSGGRLDTVAVCAVLVARRDGADAMRQVRLERFVGRLFANFGALQQAPNHPKWRDVNFAATLEGWPRAPQAQAWIDEAKNKAVAEARERESFKSFLTQAGDVVSPDSVSEADQEKLFRAFKAWSDTQQSN